MTERLQTDVLSRDADWFSRTGRYHPQHFNRDAAVDPDRPVTAEDLVSADGAAGNDAAARRG